MSSNDSNLPKNKSQRVLRSLQNNINNFFFIKMLFSVDEHHLAAMQCDGASSMGILPFKF